MPEPRSLPASSIIRLALRLGAVFLVLGWLVAPGAPAPLGATDANWTVTYNGVTHDTVNRTSNFSYTIAGGGKGAALSHLTWGVCADIVANGGAGFLGFTRTPEREGIVATVGTDPTTGVRGVKLECDTCQEFHDKDETATYTFAVAGLWAEDEAGLMGLKDGNGNYQRTITAADCECVDLEVVTMCADFMAEEPFYRNKVRNRNQNTVATGLELTDALSPDIAYDRAVSSGVSGTATCSGDGQNPETVTCVLGQLEAEETWTVDVYVTVPPGKPRDGSHAVKVTSDEPDVYTANNEDACAATTPVTVSFFEAWREGGEVRFRWSTASETGNVGFRVHVRTPSGWSPLHDDLVPSQAIDSLTPLHYVHAVGGVDGETFLLQDIDVFARSHWHGPFELGRPHGVRPEIQAIDWPAVRGTMAAEPEAAAEREAAAKREAAAEPAAAEPEAEAAPGFATEFQAHRGGAMPFGPEPARRLDWSARAGDAGVAAGAIRTGQAIAELRVREDGVYRLTFEQLAAAGIHLAGASAADLALTSRGVPVPIRVEGDGLGPGAFVEFVGRAAASRHTDANVYLLTVDRALARRVPLEQTPMRWTAPVATTFVDRQQFELPRAYSFAPPHGDPWYDTAMLAYRSPRSWTFEMDAHGYHPGAGEAMLLVDVWGVTDWPAAPDHRVLLDFNGRRMSDVTFDGRRHVPIAARLDPRLLRPGGNELKITLPADTGVDFDLVYLQAYGLVYPRNLDARDDRLAFAGDAEAFEVDALSSDDVVAYRVEARGVTRMGRLNTVPSSRGYALRFATASRPDATYLVSTAAALLTPEVTPARAAADIASRQARLLVIGHGSLLAGVEPLLAVRRAQGLTTEAVDVDDVYAQFGHSIIDPEAIRRYIAHAVAHKGTEAVLLVGADTYDPLDRLGTGAVSLVPTLYAAAGDLVTVAPSDALLADGDGDGRPDVAIGRLPVRTRAELRSVVDKTLAYEAKAYGRTAVFAADGHDGRVSFTRHADALAARLPAGWSITRALIDVDGVAASRAKLIGAMEQGAALTTYVGHSSFSGWTYKGLFAVRDAAGLKNAGRPTVVVQFGCWNTYFVSPYADTMAHTMLLAGQGGAAAVLGSATLADADAEQALGERLMERLARPGMPIGRALQEAKAQLAAERPALTDVQLTWTLLGDPMLTVEP